VSEKNKHPRLQLIKPSKKPRSNTPALRGNDREQELEIRNLASAITFLLDVAENRQMAALVGHGDEPTAEQAICNWLRPRYTQLQDLPADKRLNKACNDLIDSVCEIVDYY
jgi:hypothetical protein